MNQSEIIYFKFLFYFIFDTENTSNILFILKLNYIKIYSIRFIIISYTYNYKHNIVFNRIITNTNCK